MSKARHKRYMTLDSPEIKVERKSGTFGVCTITLTEYPHKQVRIENVNMYDLACLIRHLKSFVTKDRDAYVAMLNEVRELCPSV